MKFYRNLIILSIVLLALITTYILVPKKNETGKDLNVSGSKITVKTFKTEDMKEISIKNSSGTIVLTKVAQDWKMTNPTDFKLDTISVTSFVKNIRNFKAMDIINKKPSDLTVYGLKTPNAILTVRTKNGVSTHFKLGGQLPTGNGYYLMTSDGLVVYSISDFAAGDILRTSAEFRDKTVFAFNKKDVSFVSISKQGKVLFKFKRNAAGWDVIADTTKAGDSKKIENVIDKLSSLKVKEFINPLSYVKENVIGESNSYTIAIGIDKQPELRLIVGEDKDEGSIYVEREGPKEVFAVYKGDVDFVRSNMNDFIKK